MREAVRRHLVAAALGCLCVLALIAWLWRRYMKKQPSDVVRAIKAKVATVKATRAKPGTPTPSAEALTCEAPPVAPEAATHCPQGAPWCCAVCGNTATGDTCWVDGSKGKP
jgi:hypothetical protein